MSNSQPAAPKQSLSAQAKSARAKIEARTKAQTDKVKAEAAKFDNAHPKVKKSAIWVNRIVAGCVVIFKFLFGAFAVIAAGATAWYALNASIGTGGWGLAFTSLFWAVVCALAYLWLEKTFS